MIDFEIRVTDYNNCGYTSTNGPKLTKKYVKKIEKEVQKALKNKNNKEFI